jgi:hypothetical protein
MRPPLPRADLRRLLAAPPLSPAALPPSTDRDAWDTARQRLPAAVLARLMASAQEAALAVRIRSETERRCFQPYPERAEKWW